MKSRVNSRINNTKGKASNSFRTKVQGYGFCKRSDALGYCMFHQIYVDERLLNNKSCDKCKRFIALIS